jgi:hypothetical protein
MTVPTIQITSPLSGDTVSTTVLVSGVYALMGIVGRSADEPKPAVPPSPPIAQAPAALSTLTIVITVVGTTATTTLTVSGSSGNFAMSAPFTNHGSLAGLLDQTISASFRENGVEKANDEVANSDFTSAVAIGRVTQNNSPTYP